MGLAFAFGWTPCIGPVLGAILGVAGSTQTVGSGAGLLAVYSLGLGIPFLLAAIFSGAFLRALQGFRAHLGKVEKAMGGLLVLTGILFLTGGMQAMAFWLLETFPPSRQSASCRDAAHGPAGERSMTRTCLSVVLAAGEGTRMKSRRTKVLHEVAGRPLAAHALASSVEAGADAVALVVGRDAEAVSALGEGLAQPVQCFEQTERLGTAHAVLAAKAAIAEGYDDVLVLFGDTPLLTAQTLRRARVQLADGAAVCVVGFEAADPAAMAASSWTAPSFWRSARTRTRRRTSAVCGCATAA